MSYAKAIYPYQTGVVGDLELQVNDIIEVKIVSKKIDRSFAMIITGCRTSRWQLDSRSIERENRTCAM